MNLKTLSLSLETKPLNQINDILFSDKPHSPLKNKITNQNQIEAESESIEDQHQQLNDTLKQINSDDVIPTGTLTRTKSNVLQTINETQVDQVEQVEQVENDQGDFKFHDVKSSNQSPYNSSLKNKNYQHHSVCSQDVSSNNSFTKFDDEMIMQEDLELDGSMSNGLNICSKNLSNQLKQTKMDLDEHLDEQAMDDIDKALEEENEELHESGGFNKTFKGGLSISNYIY